jgi:hypothetical protein
MIDPTSIPHIPGDMNALTAHAGAIRAAGAAFAATGERIHTTWQALAAVYRAPEADQLLAATGPVKSVSASAGEDIQAAAAARTRSSPRPSRSTSAGSLRVASASLLVRRGPRS